MKMKNVQNMQQEIYNVKYENEKCEKHATRNLHLESNIR